MSGSPCEIFIEIDADALLPALTKNRTFPSAQKHNFLYYSIPSPSPPPLLTPHLASLGSHVFVESAGRTARNRNIGPGGLGARLWRGRRRRWSRGSRRGRTGIRGRWRRGRLRGIGRLRGRWALWEFCEGGKGWKEDWWSGCGWGGAVDIGNLVGVGPRLWWCCVLPPFASS